MAPWLSPDELKNLIQEAGTQVEIGALYEHYKGTKYRVKDIVILEATRELAVAYFAEENPEVIFIRPLKSFLEEVEVGKGYVPRFTKI